MKSSGFFLTAVILHLEEMFDIKGHQCGVSIRYSSLTILIFISVKGGCPSAGADFQRAFQLEIWNYNITL